MSNRMYVENMLEADEKFDSLVKLEGNYFIMDSEQLVANPFQELQQDATNEAQKKTTMTERLTTVKNNVCENHFQMAKGRLERQKTQKLKQLHDHSNRLRHEVKLLDLDRQRHSVEVKKRMMPERDFSYDDMQIVNTEKRLGANIASFYLDKRMKYPTRLRSVSDISVTPTIRKARASIREQQIQKTLDDYAIASRQDRAATAKTTSSILKGSSGLARRRDSRSAPAYTRNTRMGLSDKPDASTALPAIDQERRRDAWTAKSGQSHNNNQHVKFVFENPLKILASSEESANLFARSHPYYPGMVRAVNFGSDTSDEDDDDPYPAEVIDLRAVLFGEEDGYRAASVHSSHPSLTQQQMAAIRKAQGPPPKLTTDMKQEETNYINNKINAFLETLAVNRIRRRRDSDDIFADLDSDQLSHGDTVYGGHERPNNFQSKATSTAMTTTREAGGNTKSTSTSDLPGHVPNAQQHSSGPASGHPDNTTSRTSNMGTSTNPINANSMGVSADRDNDKPDVTNIAAMPANDHEKADANNTQSPRSTPKYSWRCIRGRQPDGKLQGSYKSEDLVLQALTGVPISNMLRGHVPLNSASRAMRHTATFKMHKIVEKLIHERTKYERHQVEELKKQMESEDKVETNLSNRRTSNSSVGSRSSQVIAK